MGALVQSEISDAEKAGNSGSEGKKPNLRYAWYVLFNYGIAQHPLPYNLAFQCFIHLLRQYRIFGQFEHFILPGFASAL
jgi:hypothetical protein